MLSITRYLSEHLRLEYDIQTKLATVSLAEGWEKDYDVIHTNSSNLENPFYVLNDYNISITFHTSYHIYLM
jgi:hypothetical protein